MLRVKNCVCICFECKSSQRSSFSLFLLFFSLSLLQFFLLFSHSLSYESNPINNKKIKIRRWQKILFLEKRNELARKGRVTLQELERKRKTREEKEWMEKKMRCNLLIYGTIIISSLSSFSPFPFLTLFFFFPHPTLSLFLPPSLTHSLSLSMSIPCLHTVNC